MRCDCSNRPLSPPWNNTSLKRMRRNKDLAWNSFRENPTTENLNYATLRDKTYSEEEFRLKLEYEKRLSNDLKNNCKGFYSYLRVLWSQPLRGEPRQQGCLLHLTVLANRDQLSASV